MAKGDIFKGIGFLVLAQLMVGINIVASKLLIASIPLPILLILRFSLASLVLLPLHWLSSASRYSLREYFLKLKRRDWFFLFAQAVSAGFLFNCLMLTGLHYTDANIAGIITSALPAIIAILSWLILREAISTQKAFCIAVATVGLLIIACSKLRSIGSAHSFFGDFMIFLALFPEAFYYVLCKLYLNKLPVFLTSALLNAINVVLLLPALIFTHWNPVNFNVTNWLILFIIGLSSGLFYVFLSRGAQRVDAIMTSLSTAVMPVVTVILARIVLKEDLTLLELLGMSFVLSSIVLYAKREKKSI